MTFSQFHMLFLLKEKKKKNMGSKRKPWAHKKTSFFFFLIYIQNAPSCHNVDHWDWSHHEFHDALRFSRLGVCYIFWSFQSMSKLWWTSALWSGYFMNNKKKVELGVASVHGVGVPSSHFPHPKFLDGLLQQLKSQHLFTRQTMNWLKRNFNPIRCVWGVPPLLTF